LTTLPTHPRTHPRSCTQPRSCTHSGKALRSDATLYRVVVYLAAFRMDELGAAGFRQLAASQDAQKLVVLLPYLFDGDALREYAREDWLKDYDKQVRSG